MGYFVLLKFFLNDKKSLSFLNAIKATFFIFIQNVQSLQNKEGIIKNEIFENISMLIKLKHTPWYRRKVDSQSNQKSLFGISSVHWKRVIWPVQVISVKTYNFWHLNPNYFATIKEF